MTDEERKRWRAKWIDRLVQSGTPLRELAGITDHELWQRKNRRFGAGSMNQQGSLPKIGKGRMI